MSANVDPSLFPPWTSGEISDICRPGTAIEFGFTVSTYRSQRAGACVG
jgi:hypothetical protein